MAKKRRPRAVGLLCTCLRRGSHVCLKAVSFFPLKAYFHTAVSHEPSTHSTNLPPSSSTKRRPGESRTPRKESAGKSLHAGTLLAYTDTQAIALRAPGMFRGGGMPGGRHGFGLFAFGGAYWPLATAHPDPLWIRTCFGCVNGAPG